jgi:signal transduction histidine kinase
MKLKFKQKLFISYLLIFSLFTIGIIVFQQSREKKHKTQALEEKLDAYADIIDIALIRNKNNLDSIMNIFPPNIRLTLINKQGEVIFDNAVDDLSFMENHSQRPEIRNAEKKTKASDIRKSSSNQQEYLYYAKKFNNYYIRVALPYNIHVKQFLKVDDIYIYYIVALFAIVLIMINYASQRFGKSIQKLRTFTDAVKNNNVNEINMNFPDDELGEIGKKIAENYKQLKKSKKKIILEKEKLLQHVHSSEEGICFFSKDKTVEFYNGLFIQYLNIIVDNANSEPATIFDNQAFEKLNNFLIEGKNYENYYETQIDKHGKNFAVRANIFDDKSFEIMINDITKQEKTKSLKQEMTGNITHELRTPVTSIRGCLETILEHDLNPEKKEYFIKNAYDQVLALSELIQDMGLITKIEEAPQSFNLEKISINKILSGLKTDLKLPLKEKNIKFEWNFSNEIIVNGNRNLLYSIFRNLTENVIRYAGENVTVKINIYNEDNQFYYFSYSDNGPGISEEHHLSRLFGRFYRINEGRTRDTGGSGLGLSIVKNAIAFHKGTIVAKNKQDGGLEFLFNLMK